jgi:hypothetical protein
MNALQLTLLTIVVGLLCGLQIASARGPSGR